MRQSNISVAALSTVLPCDGSVPTEFRMFPNGRFSAADGSGRPEGVSGWLMNETIAKRIIAAAKARQSQYVIDYEHQTLHAEKNGQPAPASGWLHDPEWRPDGLYYKVDWTKAAATAIESKEYRYVSPVFAWDKRTGEIVAFYHAALTNNPGLDGLTDLSALTAHFQEGEPQMKELLKALGLAETATEAEALTALAALKATHGTEVAALKAALPDPGKYVEVSAMTALQGELATARTELAILKADATKSEVDKVVTDALNAGKLTPATEKWARDLGTTNMAQLKAYIDAAPVVAKPGATQTGGKAPEGSGHQANDTDLAVMKAMGLTAEQFATGKKES